MVTSWLRHCVEQVVGAASARAESCELDAAPSEAKMESVAAAVWMDLSELTVAVPTDACVQAMSETAGAAFNSSATAAFTSDATAAADEGDGTAARAARFALNSA